MDDIASLTVVLALSVCVSAWLTTHRSFSVPRPSWDKLLSAALWLGIAALLWVSDYPSAWRLPEFVDYLAEPSWAAFRILCVTATGGVIFGSMVALLFLAGRRRR